MYYSEGEYLEDFKGKKCFLYKIFYLHACIMENQSIYAFTITIINAKINKRVLFVFNITSSNLFASCFKCSGIYFSPFHGCKR